MLIKIKKEYLSELDDVELATYVAMIALCQRPNNNYVSLNTVVYLMYSDLKQHQQIRRHHSSAISSLINNEIIIGEKIGKSEFAINVPNPTDWEYYTTVTPEEIQPIFSSNYRNKLVMLRILITVLMCRSRRTKHKVCDVSVSLLCKESGKSASTVQRALDNLVELGVLHRAKICDHRANVYGLASDSNYIDKYAQNTAKRLGQTEKVAQQPAVSEPKRVAATMDDFDEIFGPMKSMDVWNEFRKANISPTVEELRKYAETNIMH